MGAWYKKRCNIVNRTDPAYKTMCPDTAIKVKTNRELSFYATKQLH